VETAGPTLTRAAAREFDRWAIEELGMPSAALMENAGRAVADVALAELARLGARPGRVVVLCGAGNNGGDGYVVARHLLLAGVVPEIWSSAAPESMGPEAALQRRVVEGLGLSVGRIDDEASCEAAARAWDGADLLVDALLGTGFRGEVRAPLAGLILRANRARIARRLAVDLPSGLDCDLGTPARATLRADVTVTFVARKQGFDAPGAAQWTGQVLVASIGVPRD
jgi:NAD(P)H-hydrate epimerase